MFSSVKSSVFTPAFCPLISRFINFSYLGFSGGVFCSPKLQMTNYEPATDYGVKSPKSAKCPHADRKSAALPATGSPDPINAGVNLDLGWLCPEAFSKGISGRSARPWLYIAIAHWLNSWICASLGVVPSSQPSPLFQQLIRHHCFVTTSCGT